MAQTFAVLLVSLWATLARATVTQGDFSFYGQLDSAWGGRWGEGSARGGSVPPTDGVAPPQTKLIGKGVAPTATGGSFDFNHWDLIEARQGINLSTDDHLVKNFKLLGRLDTWILEDARAFANYRGWYDAFPDIKHKGRAESARDWTSFTSRDRINQFTRNELDEYYAQLDFTDSFSMRIGKQRIVWSEADVFSGTEVTNPGDFRFGNVDNGGLVNLQMIKSSYILPDYLRTTNNLFEFFWIPGDFQGSIGGPKSYFTDARNPWTPPVPIGVTLYNQAGQPFREGSLLDGGAAPVVLLPPNPALKLLSTIAGTKVFFADLNVKFSQNRISKSIDNSEFGARYSTLLPIGSGLQASAIWLYEARSPKLELCQNCTQPAPFVRFIPGIFVAAGAQNFGINMGHPVYDFGKPRFRNNLGTVRLLLHSEFVRQNFFGLTGTYYDKDLSDMVFRYDLFYAPKVAGGGFGSGSIGLGSLSSLLSGGGRGKWGETTRWVIAADRPTYIPWISKQHTFLVAQYVATWSPDSRGARALDNFFFLAANNWLMDGRLTSLNVWAWFPDDNAGLVSSSNSYRYSTNIVFSANATWFLGRSGLSNGIGAIVSRAQRTNELDFVFTYEI